VRAMVSAIGSVRRARKSAMESGRASENESERSVSELCAGCYVENESGCGVVDGEVRVNGSGTSGGGDGRGRTNGGGDGGWSDQATETEKNDVEETGQTSACVAASRCSVVPP